MKANVYIQVEMSPSSGYISITDMVMEAGIQEEYQYYKKRSKSFGFAGKKIECFESFKLRYILVEVVYDGRKKSIKSDDVLKSLETQGLVTKTGESMFGGFYLPTEALKEMLGKQFSIRRELVNQGIYETVV